MRYHWIRDQVKLRVFRITWKAGKFNNLADFLTKAHPDPVKHHLDIRWKCVLMEKRSNIASSEGVLVQV